MAFTIDAKGYGSKPAKVYTDGKRVLITSLGIGDLFIYDVASRKELKRLSIGHGALGILMDPDGTRAFVACSPDNFVAVIDLKMLEVIGKFEIKGPDGLAWSIKP